MSSQLGAIKGVNEVIAKVFQQPKGDFADRLNSTITVCLLSLSAVIMLGGHFMGDPITCWTPAQYTKQWTDFVNQYCFVHGTYYVPYNKELSFDEDERRKEPIEYYQWVPYILALQAFLFYLPRFLWKTLVSYSGYDLAGAIRYVDNFWTTIKVKDDTFRTRIPQFECRAAIYIWDGLALARNKNSRAMAACYSIANIIQTLNAWTQWMYLNSLLDQSLVSFWGPTLVGDILSGDDWKKTGHFPRVTHCDFERRHLATAPIETVLCVLGLNIFYEKLFIFLWFWFLIVALVSTFNCVYWIMALFNARTARNTIDNYLRSQENTSKVHVDDFYRALGRDGLFVLQQMALNLGDIPTSYLAIALRNTTPKQKKEETNEEKKALLPAEHV